MNQLPLNKNDLPLIREMLTKYKQGYISGLIPGSNITFSPSGCRNKIISSTGGGGGGGIESIVAGENIQVDTSDPLNPIVSANFTQDGKYLVSGGASWSGTGLVYDVSVLTYYFNGFKMSAATSVTLDASDPVDNRFDVIVVDESGVCSVIKGTASSNPEVPVIPDDQLLVTIILVEASTTEPTVLSESIYLEEVTSGWTFSTYDTGGTGTGTIDFGGTASPKQGVECIESNTDTRRGARFVRATSFDAYQYTMMSLWVRFTGSAVATNKSLNVRFENSAGSLVGNTINLFSFGLQRNILNTWQLVVVPITSFGALPATVKGLKVIMSGGTVGQARQWDLDYMVLTNGSVPYANVPTIAFYKDDIGIGSASGLNIKQGTGMTITSAINPTTGRADYTFDAAGGGSPAGSDTWIQYNNAGSFGADSGFFKTGETFGLGLLQTQQSAVTFTGSGLDDLTVAGTFSGTVPTTYTVTIDGVNQVFLRIETSSITGGSFAVSDVVTNGTGGSANIESVFVTDELTFLRVTINSGSFASGDVINNGSGVTGTLNDDEGTYDTVTYSDGTTTENNVPSFTEQTYFVNGIIFVFGATTGHTLSDEWTWTYSNVKNNILDFSNGAYKFGTDFGTDYFGYEVGNNLLVYGLKGSLNTWVNGSDFALNGIFAQDGYIVSGHQMLVGSNISVSLLEFDRVFSSVTDGTNNSLSYLSAQQFGIANTLLSGEHGIKQSAGVVEVGNLEYGNNTKITIDDVNERITISNLPSYDDDAAAGTGGLTTGMIYKTTGSGSAPLNVAGILMIKQ